MKTLSVKKVNDSAITSAEQIPTIFDIEQIPFNQIDCINWKDYPYHPDVKFRIAHTGNAILLHYCITEQSVRATAPEDNCAPCRSAATRKTNFDKVLYSPEQTTNIIILNVTVQVHY